MAFVGILMIKTFEIGGEMQFKSFETSKWLNLICKQTFLKENFKTRNNKKKGKLWYFLSERFLKSMTILFKEDIRNI